MAVLLQIGPYSWAQRLGNLGFRCVQFGIAGTFASAIGHGLVVLSVRPGGCNPFRC